MRCATNCELDSTTTAVSTRGVDDSELDGMTRAVPTELDSTTTAVSTRGVDDSELDGVTRAASPKLAFCVMAIGDDATVTSAG